MLRVRFADVDRSASRNLGVNLANSSFNQIPPSVRDLRSAPMAAGPSPFECGEHFPGRATTSTWWPPSRLSKARTCWRRWLNRTSWPLMANRPASWRAANIPYPMIQPSAGAATVTIAFKEYGVRLNFLPTSRRAAPFISRWRRKSARSISPTPSLLRASPFPASTTRRVNTEIELESGQSFRDRGPAGQAGAGNLF